MSPRSSSFQCSADALRGRREKGETAHDGGERGGQGGGACGGGGGGGGNGDGNGQGAEALTP